MRLSGVDSLTVSPALLQTLSKTEESESNIVDLSVFKKDSKGQEQNTERMKFIDDETAYREAFAKSGDGKGPVKTAQVWKVPP